MKRMNFPNRKLQRQKEASERQAKHDAKKKQKLEEQQRLIKSMEKL